MPNPASVRRGIRAAQAGLLVNAALAVAKLAAGVAGNAFVLVADAVESAADILGSLIVWGGLAISAHPPDEEHPFGHGKAEAITAALVAMMLLGAAVWISAEAVHRIRTPDELPAAWTLGVLVVVVVVKWTLARRVASVAGAIASTSVRADAWHHLSDAMTSAAAFVGISLALVGQRISGGNAWSSADDWAALVAAAIIAYNGFMLLARASHDLMDQSPGEAVVGPIRAAAQKVPGVIAVEKLHVRKTGLSFNVVAHVQASPRMPLEQAHSLGHMVQRAVMEAVPAVDSVVVHMEPYAGA